MAMKIQDKKKGEVKAKSPALCRQETSADDCGDGGHAQSDLRDRNRAAGAA